MKLISMTDFVLEQKDSYYNQRFFKIEKYAKFLKQPLELWMFVPCGDNGNFLEEPEPHYTTSSFEDCPEPCWDKKECEIYKQAKERCLFVNFRMSGKILWIEESLFMISENYNRSFKNYGNIEMILNKYLIKDIELTKTAEKLIGL